MLGVGYKLFAMKNLDYGDTLKNRTAGNPEELAFVGLMPAAIAFGNIERD